MIKLPLGVISMYDVSIICRDMVNRFWYNISVQHYLKSIIQREGSHHRIIGSGETGQFSQLKRQIVIMWISTEEKVKEKTLKKHP